MTERFRYISIQCKFTGEKGEVPPPAGDRDPGGTLQGNCKPQSGRRNTVSAHSFLNRPPNVPGTAWRKLLPALFLCLPFLCQCYIWNAHKDIKDLRQEIEAVQTDRMEASSLYHLEVAKGLLDAAEKQYEDADFFAVSELTSQAADQLDRSRKLRAYQELVEKEGAGGDL